MEAISGTSLAAFQSNKIQFDFKQQNGHVEKAAHGHHDDGDRVESSHGRKRAAQIFRQEMIQSLKIKFHSEFRLSFNSANPYTSAESPDSIAADVLSTARALAIQSSDAPSNTFAQIRESVDLALKASQEIVNTDEGAEALDDAEGLISRGLDALENDAGILSASSLSIESTSKQRTSIKIRTQEGDIVKFDLRRVDEFSASDVALQTATTTATSTEVSISSSSRLVLRVDGDLNDAELDAITNVFAQAEQLAEEFFAGDINAALEVVAGLEFDTSQLARVSMKFRSSERISAEGAIFQSTPAIPTEPAVAIEAPVDSGAILPGNPAETTPEPVAATPEVETTPEPVAVTPEVETTTVVAADPSEPTDQPTGFNSLFNYLREIADFLEQTFDQFSSSLLPGSSGGTIRFEFTETLRLEILRAVMIETAPEHIKDQDEDAGSAIQQLAEELN